MHAFSSTIAHSDLYIACACLFLTPPHSNVTLPPVVTYGEFDFPQKMQAKNTPTPHFGYVVKKVIKSLLLSVPLYNSSITILRGERALSRYAEGHQEPEVCLFLNFIKAWGHISQQS